MDGSTPVPGPLVVGDPRSCFFFSFLFFFFFFCFTRVQSAAKISDMKVSVCRGVSLEMRFSWTLGIEAAAACPLAQQVLKTAPGRAASAGQEMQRKEGQVMVAAMVMSGGARSEGDETRREQMRRVGLC
ncbi:hypothetical protein IWZ03DRAFT_388205, partial [Phyllosticta citriasiana]